MLRRGFAAAAVLFMLLLCGAACAEEIAYLDADGREKSCAAYTDVALSTEKWTTGWYVVKKNVTVDERIEVKGDVHLILVSGAKLNAKKGIRVEDGHALSIYAQTTDEAQMGELEAVSPDNQSNAHAGIGSNEKQKSGTITIAGGRVTARGASNKSGVVKSYGAAGIGGGDEGDCGKVTITGGVVTAAGGSGESGGGAGIGGGNEGHGGEVTILGGKVTATGGKYGAGIGGGDNKSNGITIIRGGDVQAKGGKYATGIGGGEKGHGGEVTISGGKVVAIGGDEAAGIGGGNEKGSGGKITITGGEVEARCTADYGAGIGGGDKGAGGTITISGGTVRATGGVDAAGIGGGDDGHGGKISISGGSVLANGGKKGAGIGSGDLENSTNHSENGGDITISGGEVKAIGGDEAAGIGGGKMSVCGTVTISGGIVYAKGGNGSEANGAGIGSGASANGGQVTVSGGFVTAMGGKSDTGNGAGIGSSGDGYFRGINEVKISGGKLVAEGQTTAVGGEKFSIEPPVGRIMIAYDADDRELSYPQTDNCIAAFGPHKRLTFVASDYNGKESGMAGGSTGGLMGALKPQAPSPVQGGGQVVVPGQSAAFSCSGSWTNAQNVKVEVYVNHKRVDPKHYTVTVEGKASRARSAGGTVRITLHADYLATLPRGQYTLFAAMDGTDGNHAAMQTGFTVAGDPNLPQTGDDSQLLLWLMLLALSAAGVWVFRRRMA